MATELKHTVKPSGGDFTTLAADGLSPLQGAGTNTSGDAAPMNFTTDIDGDTRDSTWDIGADAATGYTYNQVLAVW